MPSIMESFAEQWFLRTPAHRFTQGDHRAYLFTLQLPTADGLLPERVDDQLVRDANRKLTPAHAKNIQQYLAEDDGWLLGALMLGVAPDAVDFEAFEGYSDFGELRIRADKANTRRIFDGQHRRRAIHDVLTELRNGNGESGKSRFRELQVSSVSIVLYEEDDIGKLRQMFVDASQTKPIEAYVSSRFDSGNAFNVIAHEVSHRSKLFRDRIEMDRSSVNRASSDLASINQLVGILKRALTSNRRISRQMNREFMNNRDELVERALIWTDAFLPAAREEYQGLFESYGAGRQLPIMRGNTFAVSVTFFNLLAECYQLWCSGGTEWEPLAEFVHAADVEIGSRDNLLAKAGLMAHDGKSLFSRRQELEGAARYILSEVRRA